MSSARMNARKARMTVSTTNTNWLLTMSWCRLSFSRLLVDVVLRRFNTDTEL